MENIFIILLFSGVATWSWLMVLKPSWRRKLMPRYLHFRRLSSLDPEVADALALSYALIAAVVCSFLAIVFAIVTIFRFSG